MSQRLPSVRPALRRARVLSGGTGGRLELEILEGPLSGEVVPGVVHEELGERPPEGATVTANTVGLEMGLGSGGFAVAVPCASGGGELPRNRDHFVKLPYTPLQLPCPPAPQAESLADVPVAVLPLHSHLAPAAGAAAALRPGIRTTFLLQEGGALPAGLSRTVRELRQRGLLYRVVTAGGCFGGDLEAPNVFSGLLAAAGDADLVLCGIGPGVVGTGSPYGHGGMSAATALNAACALGAEPVLAPRLSAADPRDRHRGLSHHSRAALSAALGSCRVAVPEGGRDLLVPPDALPERHAPVEVRFGAGGLEERFGLTFESMGRGYTEDRVFFDAAAAAVALALGAEGRSP
ncbi:MAG: DUF3866 family protein [Rubrobacter sp.]|nr:DUF3866 family protein [Rubrobacter sp.]